ncbi:histidine kinase dimerization/phospho-acceptor domain-containing protein, partial [Rhizobium johnstonii]|uniref:histidine kinase dimerization/phospho-acceptor domain-containing protein n=1 Tax=Rhizobium johnstonii TaxID=3019933 RepID=UPI003F9543A9
TLAGGVAHEFNNCLGAVIGYGEMLLQSLRRRSKAFKYAEEIMATCHRALFITSEILSFIRKRETGTLPFDFQRMTANRE